MIRRLDIQKQRSVNQIWIVRGEGEYWLPDKKGGLVVMIHTISWVQL